MFKKSTLAALALAVTTGAAFAANGADQLALNVGVEPGAYSLADLVALKSADQDSQSRKSIPYILENGANGTVTRGTTADNAQLSGALGVTPSAYSTFELTAIKAAVNDGNDEEARYYTDGGYARSTGAISASDTAYQGLEATLNINADDYTLAELIILQDAVQENDTSLVRAFLK
ncbi:hypothetical protein [Pseudoruegeria sp. SK021]|uniref:hypothetical protein n=1 Tax=Pseudoruegeria sp. SK021 TaxID=1933035 RepID=UPI000A223C8F|nr:hypothetical protein [Pseudoruegeria sp. SK021]OSP55327.1 hypothetical protein BV911_07775 [Pseudoruegeria sp. SK021]